MVEIIPLTPDRWRDLADLFSRRTARGAASAAGACWCMFWRLRADDFERNWGRGTGGGAGNRRAMEGLVARGSVPGLLAYEGDRAVGWVSVAPRSEFAPSQRWPSAPAPAPPWAIVCFHVDPGSRRRGVARALLDAAVRHAFAAGAGCVEAIPADADSRDPFTGYRAMLAAAGFADVTGSDTAHGLMRRDAPAAETPVVGHRAAGRRRRSAPVTHAGARAMSARPGTETSRP